jgi:segregation and condensation protein B
MSEVDPPGTDEDPGGVDPASIREAVARLARSGARSTGSRAAPETPPGPAQPAPVPEVDPSLAEERLADALRRAEAVLFASAHPIDAVTLTGALPPGVEAGDVLMLLKARYRDRGVQLVEVAGKWRFQTAPDLAFLFEETREQPRALSRAALETLAIIAYCQPATRAEIEEVRGVAVSRGSLDALMEAGWVKPRGRRRAPGRPVTYGTTQAFLVHFGLDSLEALPGREDLRAAGLLSADLPRDFDIAGPPRDAETGAPLEELPLEDPEFQTDFMEGAEERP